MKPSLPETTIANDVAVATVAVLAEGLGISALAPELEAVRQWLFLVVLAAVEAALARQREECLRISDN